MAAPLIRLVSVPGRHPYVDAVRPHSVQACFADSSPDSPWRPSAVLAPEWVLAHRDEIDVVHVHFGFEHLSAGELTAFTATLRACGIPLVLTVHDVENPHLHDQAQHQEGLGVLVRDAAVVITLSHGAAAHILRRWGRQALVLPHPHVAPLELMGHRVARPGFVVGVHDKRRANIDPRAVRACLGAAVAEVPGGLLAPSPDRRLMDHELWEHLAALDALVLPYRFGSHSGFVEACFDLGTAVIVPKVGFFSEQKAVFGFELHDPASLRAAVLAAAAGPRPAADPAQRESEREAVAAAHADLYRQSLVRSSAA